MSRFPQHRSMHRFTRAAAAAAMGLFTGAAVGTTLPVGPGGGACTYSSIQAAINAATSGDSITVADAGTNYTEKLTITDKSLSISSCPCNHQVCLFDTTHNTLTNVTLSGAGGANAPVLKIVTTNAGNPITVNLDRVTIQDGHSGGTDGGGISFSGVGALNLTRTNVTSNKANYGAGINFKANGGDATLTIKHDTFVTYNTAAQSGGGIRVEGNGATLNVNDKSTWIAFNEATGGLGGGVEILYPALANIGSPGYLAGGVIYENTAKYGGGIADLGVLFLYTTDPLHPVAIDNNTATSTGGGLYVGGGWSACMKDFRITNNIAQEGTGIYSDVDGNGFGGDVFIAPVHGACPVLDPLGVSCDASQVCNLAQGNIARAVLNGNQATNGAAILLQSGSNFRADRLAVRDNVGGYALRALGNTIDPSLFTDVNLSNCLFAGNTVNHELLLTSDGNAHTEVTNCTLAHDTIGGARVIAADDTMTLDYNIIDEGNIPALAFSGSQSSLENLYNIADNTTGMASTPYNIQTTPTFVDAAHGDYRLFYGIRNGVHVRSAGIDYGPPVTGDDRDIRGQPHDQAITSPLFGDRDLGAYEMQGLGDRIFIDTFGDDQLLVQ